MPSVTACIALKVMGDKIKKKIVLYENVFFFTHMIHVNKLFGINRNMTGATDRQKLLWTEVSIKYGDLSPLLDDVKRDQLDVTVYLFILTTARFSNQNVFAFKSEGCFNVFVSQGSDVQKDLGAKFTPGSLQNHAELKVIYVTLII